MLTRRQSPPLKALADRQKTRDLQPLVEQQERDTRAAFAIARQEVAPVLAAFAAAYGQELDRVNADRDEDEEPEPRRVPANWLIHSGWGKRVEAAIGAAAHKAGQRSLAHLIHVHDDVAKLGQQHAQELLKLAMEPAVKAYVHRKRGHSHNGKRKR